MIRCVYIKLQLCPEGSAPLLDFRAFPHSSRLHCKYGSCLQISLYSRLFTTVSGSLSPLVSSWWFCCNLNSSSVTFSLYRANLFFPNRKHFQTQFQLFAFLFFLLHPILFSFSAPCGLFVMHWAHTYTYSCCLFPSLISHLCRACRLPPSCHRQPVFSLH